MRNPPAATRIRTPRCCTPRRRAGEAMRHRGARAVTARDVAAGGDDAAAAWMANNQGLVGERGIVTLFDGGVEGVAIDMGDGEGIQLGMADDAAVAAGRADGGVAGIGEAVAAQGRCPLGRCAGHGQGCTGGGG